LLFCSRSAVLEAAPLRFPVESIVATARQRGREAGDACAAQRQEAHAGSGAQLLDIGRLVMVDAIHREHHQLGPWDGLGPQTLAVFDAAIKSKSNSLHIRHRGTKAAVSFNQSWPAARH